METQELTKNNGNEKMKDIFNKKKVNDDIKINDKTPLEGSLDKEKTLMTIKSTLNNIKDKAANELKEKENISLEFIEKAEISIKKKSIEDILTKGGEISDEQLLEMKKKSNFYFKKKYLIFYYFLVNAHKAKKNQM